MEVICSKCGTKNVIDNDKTSGFCESCQEEIFYTCEVSETILGDSTESPVVHSKKEIPEQFGRYQVISEIGRGGMGVVLKSYDTVLKRNIALKILLYSDESIVKRFLQEAQTMASLDHNHIIKVYDVGQQDGLPYIVMDLIDGISLKEYLQQNRLDAKQTAVMMQKIAKAMAYAHEKGVIHRDLKPANIMLKGEEPIVMDFGLAKIQQAEEGLSKTGSVMGTFLYMSPEQANGMKVDQRTDIYAMGCIFYEMLAGRPPFDGETTFSLINKILNEKPQKITSIKESVSPELEKICMCALAKNCDERYSDAQSFAGDLDNFLHNKKVEGVSKKANISWQKWFGVAAIIFVVASICWLLFSTSGQKTWSSIVKKMFVVPPEDWPADLWQNVWQDKDNYIDFTTDAWLALSHDEQTKYAKSYQKWYAETNGLPIEKKQKIVIEDAEAEFEFLLAPPGKFWMGSPEDERERNEDEMRHKVLISKPFWLGKYEVTQGQWRIFKHPQNYLDDKHPAYIMSWGECQEFCEKTGLVLPTEAQWEYACRGGTTAVFSTGDDIDAKYVNYNGTIPYKRSLQPQKYRWQTTEVGSLDNANSWGYYDMHGNLQEWCVDDYVEYRSEELIDPVVINDLGIKVYRGGCRYTSGAYCRSACRVQCKADYSGTNLGFRVILPIKE